MRRVEVHPEVSTLRSMAVKSFGTIKTQVDVGSFVAGSDEGRGKVM